MKNIFYNLLAVKESTDWIISGLEMVLMFSCCWLGEVPVFVYWDIGGMIVTSLVTRITIIVNITCSFQPHRMGRGGLGRWSGHAGIIGGWSALICSGKLVQLQSIWLPATGQNTVSQPPVSTFRDFKKYIFGNIQLAIKLLLVNFLQ